jgi:outer membrane protein TolC
LLADTEARLPELEIALRRAEHTLSVLLGAPPHDLSPLLGAAQGIPAAPDRVAVGIPADLLRRRPDVRRAERELAAQSARIGVREGDLYPQLQLVGAVGFSAERAAEVFQGESFSAFGGPAVQWPILNYGRLVNAVRVEDARFQELVAGYEQTVLRAQQEVEDALVGYVRGRDQVTSLERSVDAANRAVELSLIQYKEGAADYSRVLQTQQSKLQAEDDLAATRGDVTLSVIGLYRALGGGWEIRGDAELLPQATREEMRGRTWWGDTLDAQLPSQDEDEAFVAPAASSVADGASSAPPEADDSNGPDEAPVVRPR